MGRIAQAQQQKQQRPNVEDVARSWDNVQWVQQYRPAVKAVLPKSLDLDRFMRIILTEVKSNYKLKTCDPKTLVGAIMQAAQCGLEIGGALGQAYIVPYKGEAVLQIGYKGMIQLCRRSGDIALIKAQTVYENDEFEYSLGLNPDLKHIPARSNRGNPVAYYAFYKTKDGFVDFEVMTHEEVLAHAHRFSATSKNGVFSSSSPWAKDFDAMAKKTVLKKVLKYAPMATDFQNAMTADEAVSSIDISQDTTELPSLDNIEIQQIGTEEDEEAPIEINGQAGEIIEGEVLNA